MWAGIVKHFLDIDLWLNIDKRHVIHSTTTPDMPHPNNNKRRHNSMLVTGAKDRSKWLQEYSGFNIMEL